MAIDQSTLPSWDLTQYYVFHKDRAIFTDLESIKAELEGFANKFRGKVGELSATELLVAIKLQEDLIVRLYKPSYFLGTSYEAGGDQVDEINGVMVKVEEMTTNLANLMVFWDVELSKRNDLNELSKSQELKEYRYMLERTALEAKHTLSEEVEKVLNLKSLTSNHAWSKLYTDMKGKIEVKHDFGDGEKTYRTPDLGDKMMSTNREVRSKAFELLTGEYEKNEEIVLEAYNNILLDTKIRDSLRGFEDCEDAKLLSNQVSREVVDSLIGSIKNHTKYYQEYLGIKKDLLKMDEMRSYDVGADIDFGAEEKEYSWQECQNIILDAFGKFDADFERIAKQFFDNNWIDAQVRPRKYGGAFMSDFAPQFHPVILCNYKGKMEDILTVAHELGHGIHSVLMNRKQAYFNTHYAMTVAEIASLCCETVVFNALFEQATDPKLRLKLLCTKIEQEAGNIFTGGLGRYVFERDMHTTYRKQGPISKEQVREMWLNDYYGTMFGDSVVPTKGSEYVWQGTAHFTNIFYNYVYASGLLISSSIFEVLKTDPSKVSMYKEMLADGGSISPVELLQKIDMDIEKPEFWDIGFKLFVARLDQIKKELALLS
jgi:oligoendopeptidase F